MIWQETVGILQKIIPTDFNIKIRGCAKDSAQPLIDANMFYLCSQISRIAVRSSSSITTFAKAGIQIKSIPMGAK